MTDMVMRPATRPAGAVSRLRPWTASRLNPQETSIDIDAEISALEQRLADLVAARDAQITEDTTPWVLDYSDDEWDGSGSVGQTALSLIHI